MIKKAYLLILSLTSLTPLLAQNPADHRFVVGLRLGDQYANVSRFQEWSLDHQLGALEPVVRNRMIALDMIYQHGKTPIIINMEFDIHDRQRPKPYFFHLGMMTGRTLVDFPVRIDLIGGLGLGYAFLQFGNRTPAQFLALPYNHSEAYARSFLFTARTGLMASYTIPLGKLIRPMLYAQATANQRLYQADFFYGQRLVGNDGEDYFVGTRTNMPRFYRNSISISIGLALDLFRW